MAGAFKRTRHGKPARRWTGWYRDAAGASRQFAGLSDKAETLKLANAREAEAALIREGLVGPHDRSRREASLRPVADHVEDYRLSLLDKGGTPKHASHTAGVLLRILSDAAIESVADVSPDRVASALGRLAASGRSARTVNHALAAVKGFARWLADGNRITEAPRGLARLRPRNEEADRRRTRRALTPDEVARLISAAEAGPTRTAFKAGRGGPVSGRITGPERAAVYRLAIGTGFRAEEIRLLEREQYRLEGDEPTISLRANQTKNGRAAVQPISLGLAARLRPFVDAAEPGRPVFALPVRTADMLRADMLAAGVEYETAEGVADFHALRGLYITNLIMSGVDPKTAQELARHSTPTLTIGRYTRTNAKIKRDAVGEGE
jgi:integrase